MTNLRAGAPGASGRPGAPAGPGGHDTANGPGADAHAELRAAVRAVCERFPDEYWRGLDARRQYPEAFVEAMTQAGFLAALIPQEYGGMGLGMEEASVILEEINRSGGNAQPAHAQVYTMGTLLRHGSEAQRSEYLPRIASGEIRLQAFGVTEPEAGTDTTSLRTTAVRDGDSYVVNGHKIFISRVQYSDFMILLARTTPREQVKRRSDGLSVFLVDLREAIGNGLTVKPRNVMINNITNELVFEDLSIPASSLIGTEGEGFRYILDGMNAERILIAGECVGNGRWFVDRARARATEREVFGRPIGQNQGIQFPLARAHIGVEAADLMRFRAAGLFDAHVACGAEANMALLLAAEASWDAANAAMQTFGGYGFDAEYDVERKFRETRLFQVAPISTNLILSYVGEHVLGLPRSF
ncbi:MAG: acyl-CoA dehydrogenase [Solirubrobacteraceae bacterium]|nr:acyl-CoA dehydrogenase [Solirubrobacteraceae bacterium]